jgi:sporulation protein YlmC with PRC-barrel domain
MLYGPAQITRADLGRSGNMFSIRNLAVVASCAIATMAPIRRAAAQVAGETTLGVTVEELKLVVLGWSVKKQMLGQDVHNEKNENIGDVEDVIVSPKKTVSWALIGVGGFLGVGEKLVAIPMDQLQMQKGKLILKGATKDALKKMPEFRYAT